jgi:hypothetical protein
MVCCKYIIVNTLHKGDKKDNDDDNNNNIHCTRHHDRKMVHTHTHTEVTPNRPDIIIKNKK